MKKIDPIALREMVESVQRRKSAELKLAADQSNKRRESWVQIQLGWWKEKLPEKLVEAASRGESMIRIELGEGSSNTDPSRLAELLIEHCKENGLSALARRSMFTHTDETIESGIYVIVTF